MTQSPRIEMKIVFLGVLLALGSSEVKRTKICETTDQNFQIPRLGDLPIHYCQREYSMKRLLHHFSNEGNKGFLNSSISLPLHDFLLEEEPQNWNFLSMACEASQKVLPLSIQTKTANGWNENILTRIYPFQNPNGKKCIGARKACVENWASVFPSVNDGESTGKKEENAKDKADNVIESPVMNEMRKIDFLEVAYLCVPGALRNNPTFTTLALYENGVQEILDFRSFCPLDTLDVEVIFAMEGSNCDWESARDITPLVSNSCAKKKLDGSVLVDGSVFQDSCFFDWNEMAEYRTLRGDPLCKDRYIAAIGKCVMKSPNTIGKAYLHLQELVLSASNRRNKILDLSPKESYKFLACTFGITELKKVTTQLETYHYCCFMQMLNLNVHCSFNGVELEIASDSGSDGDVALLKGWMQRVMSQVDSDMTCDAYRLPVDPTFLGCNQLPPP